MLMKKLFQVKMLEFCKEFPKIYTSKRLELMYRKVKCLDSMQLEILLNEALATLPDHYLPTVRTMTDLAEKLFGRPDAYESMSDSQKSLYDKIEGHECHACESSGLISAINKNDKEEEYFKCFCIIGQNRYKKLDTPTWGRKFLADYLPKYQEKFEKEDHEVARKDIAINETIVQDLKSKPIGESLKTLNLDKKRPIK